MAAEAEPQDTPPHPPGGAGRLGGGRYTDLFPNFRLFDIFAQQMFV